MANKDDKGLAAGRPRPNKAQRRRSFEAQTFHITPGSPWENGYCESFNDSMRHELLNGEILYSLAEAQILI